MKHICSKCKREKDDVDFYYRISGKRYYWCKDCTHDQRDARPMCPRCNYHRLRQGEDLCGGCYGLIRRELGLPNNFN